jgi:hypothetical protein
VQLLGILAVAVEWEEFLVELVAAEVEQMLEIYREMLELLTPVVVEQEG